MVVEFVQTVAIASAGPDSDDDVGNAITVKAFRVSQVVVKAGLLVTSSEVATCEAETEALADPLLGETMPVTWLGPWTDPVEAEAAAWAFSDI